MRQFEALNITELCSSALEKRYLVSFQNSFFEANQVMVDLLVSLCKYLLKCYVKKMGICYLLCL